MAMLNNQRVAIFDSMVRFFREILWETIGFTWNLSPCGAHKFVGNLVSILDTLRQSNMAMENHPWIISTLK